MAIRGVRNSMSTGIQASGARTGLIWLINNGTTTHESHRLDATDAAEAIGKSLDAAGSRTTKRVGFPIPNDRQKQV